MLVDPVLSVGIPVFNGGQWLEDALASMLSQSYADFEIVVSDNASTDDTEAIGRAAAAEDSRVRYHRNATNLGAHRNYDRVFELARGRYFKWASCMDICAAGFFEKCVAVLEARPDVVLAYPRTLMVYPRPGGGEPLAWEYEDHLDIQDEQPSARFRRYLDTEKLNNVMNGVMRTSALRETALNRPLPGSDISMIAELALRGKFVEIPDRLFVRRLDPKTTRVLVDRATSYPVSIQYLVKPTNVQRIQLHSYRFVTALRAPIAFGEKMRVWRYLLRRFVGLRHQMLRRVARLGR